MGQIGPHFSVDSYRDCFTQLGVLGRLDAVCIVCPERCRTHNNECPADAWRAGLVSSFSSSRKEQLNTMPFAADDALQACLAPASTSVSGAGARTAADRASASTSVSGAGARTAADRASASKRRRSQCKDCRAGATSPCPLNSLARHPQAPAPAPGPDYARISLHLNNAPPLHFLIDHSSPNTPYLPRTSSTLGARGRGHSGALPW